MKIIVLNITSHLPLDSPAFCDSKGKALTLNRLNRCLNMFLNSHFKHGKISGHSFRAGLVTMFAKLGYDSFQLKQIGRWSSRAYECYIKLGQTKRFQMATDSLSEVFGCKKLHEKNINKSFFDEDNCFEIEIL